MARALRSLSVVLLTVAAGLSGCSAEGTAPFLGLPAPDGTASQTAAADPKRPTPQAPQAVALLPSQIVGTATDVYTRIARGALTCWFGADGPLKSKYIYHAEANPASRGGNSEIKIMTRDAEADDPRALRAYRISITPAAGTTAVEVENARMPEPMAARLKEDVERWSGDEAGCGKGPVTGGWGAEQVAGSGPAKKKKEQTKKP